MIHENEFGHIAICKCCGEFHVSFGNVILTLGAEEMRDFEALMLDMESYSNLLSARCQNKFMVRYNDQDVVLAFTRKEMSGVIELIEMTKIVMTTNQLIR